MPCRTRKGIATALYITKELSRSTAHTLQYGSVLSVIARYNEV